MKLAITGRPGIGKTTACLKIYEALKDRLTIKGFITREIRRNRERIGFEIIELDSGRKFKLAEKGEGYPRVGKYRVFVKNLDEIAKRIPEYQADLLIIDTAGRLHIDEELMGELARIREKMTPQEILLVADAMTGQDAVNVAKRFNEVLDITGVILTKMEGDARGGAALSIRAVTDKPIKFIGVGEKIDALEPFFPDRMASRILGMGDVLTLIEKAQEGFDRKEAEKLEKKLRKAEFDFEDFLTQLRQIKKLGSLEQILGMLPGMGQLKKVKQLKSDERELVKVEAIINSMTKEERRNYKIINGSRRRRIARGSGTSVQDVNRLIKNFAQMKKMMERFSKKGARGLPSFFS